MSKELIWCWEKRKDEFIELPKSEFDCLVRAGKFEAGPLRTDHSKFMQEYGPYSPERWAFGKLLDGRLVRAKV